MTPVILGNVAICYRVTHCGQYALYGIFKRTCLCGGIVLISNYFPFRSAVCIRINIRALFGEYKQVGVALFSEKYIGEHLCYKILRLSLCFCFVCFFNEVCVCGYKHCGKYCNHRNNYYQLHNREAASFVLFCHGFVSLHIEIMIFYIHPQTRENSEKTSRQA